MPDQYDTVPLPHGGSAISNGDSAMLDFENREKLNAYIRDHVREIVPFLRAKSAEKKLSNETIMDITEIPKSTFYRIWKIATPEEEIDPKTQKPYTPSPDSIARLCLLLGVSVTEHNTPPTEESTVQLPGLRENSHEEVMNNLLAELNRQKEIIATLTGDNSKKSDRIVVLDQELKRRIDENAELRAAYSKRIDELTDALIERHDHMHELNRLHNDRVDRLDTALRQRYDQLHELFMAVISSNPQRLMELIQETEKSK